MENTISREAASGALPPVGMAFGPTPTTSKLKLPKAALLAPEAKKASETTTLTPIGRTAMATQKSAITFAKTPRLVRHVAMVGVVAVIVFGGNTGHSAQLSAIASPGGYGSVLDDAAAADVANTVAQTTNLVISHDTEVTAKTLNSQVSLVTSDDNTLAKRQVIDTAGVVSHDVQTYIVVGGDTISTIAAKYNITSDTVRWANNITEETSLKPGQSLSILPVSGIRYTVGAGDSSASLAAKYQANAEQIIAFNNAEASGLQTGASIIIPDGVIPEAPKPTVIAASGSSANNSVSSTPIASHSFVGGPNSYAYGYCTYYVASRRSVPAFWGNANAWYSNAQISGFGVGSTPSPGAIAWSGAGFYGHVAYVESVSGGMVTVSEMNYNGNWNRVTSRTVPASTFRYIY